MLPFLLSINSPLFDIQSCNFSKSNMERVETKADGGKVPKAGSG